MLSQLMIFLPDNRELRGGGPRCLRLKLRKQTAHQIDAYSVHLSIYPGTSTVCRHTCKYYCTSTGYAFAHCPRVQYSIRQLKSHHNSVPSNTFYQQTHPAQLSTTAPSHHVDTPPPGLSRRDSWLLLPHPSHRLGPILPLRASRRTHRAGTPPPNPAHLRDNNPPTPPLANRPLPLLALPPEHRLAPRLRQQPAPLPGGQTLRPALHPLLHPRRAEPLALVPAFLAAAAAGSPRDG